MLVLFTVWYLKYQSFVVEKYFSFAADASLSVLSAKGADLATESNTLQKLPPVVPLITCN